MAARVHQPRVALGQGLGVQAKPAQRARPEVRQEDVSCLKEPAERVAAPRVVQVQGDGPLASVGQRHRQVDPAAVRPDALGRQPPVRVALQSLDPDDVRSPVGQQRAGDGPRTHPLGKLYDPQAAEGFFVHRYLAVNGLLTRSLTRVTVERDSRFV